MDEEKVYETRKKNLINFSKKKYLLAVYIALAIIVYLAIHVRSLPMEINPNTGKPGLWDVTTDSWTLGPDLDPFLFLRWAKHIVAGGTLVDWIDPMRYVPNGFETVTN
jgi:hypothetical protein